MLEVERSVRRIVSIIALLGSAYWISFYPVNWIVIAFSFSIGESVITGIAIGVMKAIYENKN